MIRNSFQNLHESDTKCGAAVICGARAVAGKIVFAESCTAGLVAATMGRIPGVSDYLCGSAVTYRGETKMAWLGIDASDLAKHTAVSQCVTEAMAENVLQRTPEASLAVAVTGHFGPDAPAELDGVVFISVAERTAPVTQTQRRTLTSTDRGERQTEAVQAVLLAALEAIKSA